MTRSINSFKAKQALTVQGKEYTYYSLPEAYKSLGDLNTLPFSLKVLLENQLRHEDGQIIKSEDIQSFGKWLEKKTSTQEIAFYPARVLMQDFTGVPGVVDLATMRDAMATLGGNPESINPLIPVDLVIDHSVMVDTYGDAGAFQDNVRQEFERNGERYAFLKWGQKSFKNFRVVPPGTGICHQVNLEYLAQGVWTSESDSGETIAYWDTLVGTDSHTTMVNGMGVLGWGVGGIEAEAAMLGQSLSMVLPDVVGFRLVGSMKEGITATDLVLTITNILRSTGVVGKFVEFYGPGLSQLTLADRATVANMAPEYGATCGIFPIDQVTLDYMTFTGRAPEQIALVEAYAKAQGMWRDESSIDPVFSQTITLDLSTVEPTLAGPKRPQDKLILSTVAKNTQEILVSEGTHQGTFDLQGKTHTLTSGDVVIAAITSCTNTSNPSVLVAAGLLARKARALGLTAKPWVKTSLAPGSQVVTDYLKSSGLDKDLEALGFYLVGYGCTTCIGNSGRLLDPIAETIRSNDITVAGVLSGNRNFEGRIHPQVKLNYLASPPLVVAYSIFGTVAKDIATEPLGTSSSGAPIYLKDLWPSNAEIQATIESCLTPQMFKERYADVFNGGAEWQAIKAEKTLTFNWDEKSTYVKKAPYFEGLSKDPSKTQNIQKARCLALLGDSITTDHISPAGSIKPDGPAGSYLLKKFGVDAAHSRTVDFNSFGARRGNHEVMVRGTFANIRLQNEMTPEVTGGMTRYIPTNEVMSIFEASQHYQQSKTPLVVVAGKEYGTGSSRDWAAKGTLLLGVKAVMAESFERIHRSNLVGMGILPLVFPEGVNRKTLNLTGDEVFSFTGIEEGLKPRGIIPCQIEYKNGDTKTVNMICRIDTLDELENYKNGGVLSYVLRTLASRSLAA